MLNISGKVLNLKILDKVLYEACLKNRFNGMLYYPKSHGHKESASYDPFASHSAPAQEKVTNFEKKLFSHL